MERALDFISKRAFGTLELTKGMALPHGHLICIFRKLFLLGILEKHFALKIPDIAWKGILPADSLCGG